MRDTRVCKPILMVGGINLVGACCDSLLTVWIHRNMIDIDID
ncbi:MAG: hypothetical protein WBN72_04915 [Nitrososphaeraceae archaeon]